MKKVLGSEMKERRVIKRVCKCISTATISCLGKRKASLYKETEMSNTTQ